MHNIYQQRSSGSNKDPVSGELCSFQSTLGHSCSTEPTIIVPLRSTLCYNMSLIGSTRLALNNDPVASRHVPCVRAVWLGLAPTPISRQLIFTPCLQQRAQSSFSVFRFKRVNGGVILCAVGCSNVCMSKLG